VVSVASEHSMGCAMANIMQCTGLMMDEMNLKHVMVEECADMDIQ
jgi:hypothetical protein